MCDHFCITSGVPAARPHLNAEAAILRAEMVDGLRCHPELGPRVIAAMSEVPRHLFLPGVALPVAYADRAVPIRWQDGVPTSSASQPGIVAIMLEMLAAPEGGSILEIGAGTGYNAALLGYLVGPGGRVVSAEIDPEVARGAAANLATAGVGNVEVVTADGFGGCSLGAPYDGIVVTAGTSDLAPSWVDQLADLGRLVVPLSIAGAQQCVAFSSAGAAHLRSVAVCECGFMPLQGAMANTDRALEVPGHPGVFVTAGPGTEVDEQLVAEALSAPAPAWPTGVTASFRGIFGGLRRWLAFEEPRWISLTYLSPDLAAKSAVPQLLDFPLPGAAQWSTLAVLGPTGLAALDRAGSGLGEGLDTEFELTVRLFGEAESEGGRLKDLLNGWNDAGRPDASRLRIDAYMSSRALTPASSSVHRSTYATFVVSW